ncbi:MAG: transposase [Candidatus Rokubacteria bacterium]|nr:transposase [Candidatus Rokubacteria bacterium]
MARTARVVVEHFPHHIVQRGNRSQPVFFWDGDKAEYLRLLAQFSRRHGVAIWAYCLMDTHVHLIAVPSQALGLARALAETHKRYTRMINFRHGWRGFLWQGRFSSYLMDERYLAAAMRYVERNPVAAGMVRRAEEYAWSSAKAHVFKHPDPVLSPCFLEEQITNWSAYLREEPEPPTPLEQHLRTGRPLGDPKFIRVLERRVGRRLGRGKPGPKPQKPK